MAPTPGHTYLGYFVKKDGIIDKGFDSLLDLLRGTDLCKRDLFDYVDGAEKAHKILTRHRGMILRVLSGYAERVRDPLKKSDSFFGLLRAHETNDPEDARGVVKEFVDCLFCCAEPYFVWRMQKIARKIARESNMTPEDFLLSAAVREVMEYCGNTPPLLTISSMETTHAFFVNMFKSRGFACTGPESVIQDLMMARWRGTSEERLLQEVRY